MGEHDAERQALNVFRMRLMEPGRPRRKRRPDPQGRNQRGASRLVGKLEHTHYLSAPRPGASYPTMVREYQRVIGREARAQMLGQLADCTTRRLPASAVDRTPSACRRLLADDVELIGVEAAGRGLDGAEHAATLLRGTPGILHGAETFVLQDDDGQIAGTWSVSAGLDYPAVGPEHAHLKDSGRGRYVGATDAEALAAFQALAISEGILCAFESAHALAYALKIADERPDAVLLVSCSAAATRTSRSRALLGPSA